MRRGILVVAALGTLAGCRDFQLPTLGYQGPLKVDPTVLAVAPQETATFQVEGGTPPYTVGPASQSGSTPGSTYLAFPLTAQGSGGFAAVDGAQVDYTAGTGDTTGGKDTADAFVVRDAKGAKVTVNVAIGPPVALHVGSGASAASVPPGQTLNLGATGGKGPYLFGLSGDASGGLVDAVTGHYRAGPVGCVSDVVLVRDALGATAVAPVHVQCPSRAESPHDVVAARLADIGGTGARIFYLTTRGTNGGDVELPVYGGVPVAVQLPGPPVAAAAPHLGGGLVVAVSEFDGIHLVSVGTGQGVQDLVATGASYPIPAGSTLHLTSGGAISAITSGVAVATWTTPQGATFAARVVLGQTGAPVASIPSQTGLGGGDADATVSAFSATGALALAYLHFYLPAGGGAVQAVVDTGAGFGGQAPLSTTITSFATLLGAAGSDGTDVALLGADANGNRMVAVVSYDAFTNRFTVLAPPSPVKLAADRIAFGHVRGPYTEDYVVASKAGQVHLLYFSPLGGSLVDRPTAWFLPPGIHDLFVGDVDGDGLGEILASGDPAGDQTVEVNPSDLPRQASPSRAVYGSGALLPTAVGTFAGHDGAPAIFSIDAGRFADGSDASGKGGELAVVLGGADVGDPTPLKLPVAGGVVQQVVAARLRDNALGLPQNPSDLVAVVTAGAATQVWVAEYTHPGLAPDLLPLGGTKSPTSFPEAHLAVLPVPGTSPARDAVVIVDKQGMRLLHWDASQPGDLALSAPVPGQWGWPAANLGDPKNPGTLVALRQDPGMLTPMRIGVDAAGTGLTTANVTGLQGTGTATYPAISGSLQVPTVAYHDPNNGQMMALLEGGTILELGGSDMPQCTLDVPGTVDAMALVRTATDGSVLVATLDATDAVLRTVRLFGGTTGQAVVDRQALQGSPAWLTVGDVIGDDKVPDVVVGGTPLTVFPGVPDALLTTRRALTCQ